jgi:predicted phosphoribosyltransferase
MGALASGGVRVLNHNVVDALAIPSHLIERVAAREQAELERRERAYRNRRPPADVKDAAVILVDDGLATGASMRAAIEALRGLHPSRIVVAVPVAAAETCASLRRLVDDVVCAFMPEPFEGVGRWYADFAPVSDAEVRDLLARAEKSHEPRVRTYRSN